jgi:hypothetical protein
VGLLNGLEQRLDRIVNGTFSRAFKSQVDPVELAAALQQEIDLQAATINGRRVAPNVFIFELSQIDYQRLGPYLANLATELTSVARAYLVEQRYVVVGQLSISFGRDDDFATGVFRIRSDMTDSAVSLHSLDLDPRVTRQVPQEVAAAALVPRIVTVTGQQFDLNRPITTLGRGEQADIRIGDAGASRVHCEIILGSEVTLRDLGSTNGTLVDGARVTEATLLDGSIIRIGETTLTYKSR